MSRSASQAGDIAELAARASRRVAELERQIAEMAPADAELPPGAEMYWDAFWELSTDRPQSGFGVHPIPRWAIAVYARDLGLGPEDADMLKAAVRAADAVYCEETAKKIKAESESK